MPETESFDAFYARTVRSVTSQMHALAGDDGAADHAIREAYAMAYQQWYQASRYPDPEAWVLSAAKDAYQRRRPNGPLTTSATAPGDDNSTWPGIYRPSPAGGRPADAADGYRPPARHGRATAQPAGAPSAPAGPPWDAAPAEYSPAPTSAPTSAPTWSAATAGAATAAYQGPAGPAGGAWQSGTPATTALASPPPAGPTEPARRLGLPARGRPARSRRPLIAAVVAIVLIAVAAIGYVVVSGGHKAPPAAGTRKNAVTHASKPKPHMLAAGKNGGLAAIPWSLIGKGWTLAEVSSAATNTGNASSGGTYTTYLVDPKGGKYLITSSTGASAPELVAWSGNAQNALFATVGPGDVAPSYSLLSLKTGQLAQLSLPANVNAVGFTRPLGLAILAVKQGPAVFKLQRYTLTGSFQATIAEMVRKPGESWSPEVCGTGCSALSSPLGYTDVWGIAGAEMQVLSNAGGRARRLHVPDSGIPPSCVPVSWWTESTVLADCAATNDTTPGATSLWLVPTAGGKPTQVTAPAGGESGGGVSTGAWTADGTVYVNTTSFSQCAGAASGPGGLGIVPASQAGSGSPLQVSGTTNNHNAIVAGVGDRLLVLGQTSCPGTSSLLWYRPSNGTTQPLLMEPATEVGVIAAVPFGPGPTAVALNG